MIYVFVLCIENVPLCFNIKYSIIPVPLCFNIKYSIIPVPLCFNIKYSIINKYHILKVTEGQSDLTFHKILFIKNVQFFTFEICRLHLCFEMFVAGHTDPSQ